jgi:hypothetical protein
MSQVRADFEYLPQMICIYLQIDAGLTTQGMAN